MSILVLNAGSSTLKFSVWDSAADRGGDSLAAASSAVSTADQGCERISGTVENWKGDRPGCTLRAAGSHQSMPAKWNAAQSLFSNLQRLCQHEQAANWEAVGHRLVHGGPHFHSTVRLTGEVLQELKNIQHLAPLHLPVALGLVQQIQDQLPGMAQYAVFDTAFYRTLPPTSYLYPVPWDWYENYGVRRYGFHGISHQYCSQRACELLWQRQRPCDRLIVCHLGSGCSMTAIAKGIPVETTMGFTPMEGLMMGTRSGSIDPGILFYLQRQFGCDPEDLERQLNQQSGLLGVSGQSADYRQVEAAAEQGDQRSRWALEMFAKRIRASIAGMIVELGGVDGLVFTGGIGTNSARLRDQVMEGLQCFGFRWDSQANRACRADAVLEHGGIPVLVLQTGEEAMVGQEVRAAIGAAYRS